MISSLVPMFIGSGNVKATADNDHLFYENANVTITADTDYFVSGSFWFDDGCSGVSVKIYVGLGPDETSTTGAIELTVLQPSSFTSV